MDELLRQLGELVLGSAPTMLIFLTLVGAYAVLVYGPLKRTLAERRARTEGAMEKANAAIAAAEAKSQEYEARLRAARLEIFSRRDKQLHEWYAARDAAITAAREESHRKVVAARAALAAQAEDARRSLGSSIEQLSLQILEAILPGRGAQSSGPAQSGIPEQAQ